MKKNILFAFIFFVTSAIFAREITVYVLDYDLDLPLEGAAVRIQDGAQAFCDEDGKAVLEIPDRQVIAQASYPGYEPGRIIIPVTGNVFTIQLRLMGIMQSRELVIEASRPGTSDSQAGRSVALSEREISQTAEIGIVEDVMNSVKLLPGVGYTGMFNGMPSIRGGDPGDLMASYDGFYLENPYHWMGGISIFDPKMISSAKLSHGVFSARYGHTTSGLLEISSKNPSNTETEFEAAIGSSAASLNLSVPFNGKGGFLFMGKITYWDTLVFAAKELSKTVEDETLDLINSVSTSPFIRSASLSMNYDITSSATWRLNAFFGSDGVGIELNTDYSRFSGGGVSGIVETRADYGNYQTFLITGINASPFPKLALRFTGGAGYNYTIADAFFNNDVTVRFNDDFIKIFNDANWNNTLKNIFGLNNESYTAPNINVNALMKNSNFNAQLRADADYEIGNGFIAALGVQELYAIWAQTADVTLDFMEFSFKDSPDYMTKMFQNMSIPGTGYTSLYDALIAIDNLRIVFPMGASMTDVVNHGFTTSAYGLIEYASPGSRFGAELGLRMDHLFFLGDGFNIQTEPALNPRLNLDFVILRDKGFADSLSLTAGTGLFSSIPSLLSYFNPSEFRIKDASEIDGLYFKFNRSWTSLIGLKFDFLGKYNFNIEGYYKHVFDRAYITVNLIGASETDVQILPTFNFDGIGNVWGFDLQLQKMESRYIDGWISYSYTWAQYKDPAPSNISLGMGSGPVGSVGSGNGEWYYPSFHRYHNANIVLNIKPSPNFNIGARFGFASGRETTKITYGDPYPYPVLLIDEENTPSIIQKYRRDRLNTEIIRSAWSLPLDIKFTFFSHSKNGRASMETYLAAENVLSLLYNPTQDRKALNEYTGKIEERASSANFEFPIPLVSFGIKWKY